MNMEAAAYKERFKHLKGVVVIPTYNNATTLCDVISKVREYAEDILVVNDGSTDSTEEILRKIPDIHLISYAQNRGKGYALNRALHVAISSGYRYAVTIDADGQHFADDLPVFIDRIEQVPDSLLIGARNLQADNMPSKNTFANRFSNFWFRVETGKRLSDTQSGYRLYPLERLRNIRLFSHRYEFEVEIIVRAVWKGIHVENVPIRVYYPPAEERISHFRPFRDFARISVLNTLLVLIALLFYYPWKFIRSINRKNIHEFIDRQLIHSGESNIRLALAMGWGVFSGIIPLWGYQMIFAVLTAHLFKLNKIVALVFSNISVPPMIPFILYGSIEMGGLVLGSDVTYSLKDISLDQVMLSLSQYMVGSIVLAIVCGLSVFLIAYLAMIVFKRKPQHA